jgi:hydrogenase nickel incorporation protein HypA/HybF
MHEMSIALNIVDLSVETARQNKAEKINAIVLELGELAGVVEESLQFCFESACKGTMAEGARLEIIKLAAKAQCEHCGHEFNADQPIMHCPQCGALTFPISGGRELRIKSINVD